MTSGCSSRILADHKSSFKSQPRRSSSVARAPSITRTEFSFRMDAIGLFAIQHLLEELLRNAAPLLVGPAVRGLKQGTQMIDLAGMIEVMSDRNTDDISGWQ